jgi:putative membrane protein insertion efficiency factor
VPAPAAPAAPAAAVAPTAGVIPAATVLPGPPVAATGERGRRRGRLRRVAAPLLLACLLAIDLARPPASQASARLLLGGIHLYQATLSPHMASLGVRCRFRPTCSHYAAGAIARYGALSGGLRAAWRLVRCGPWTPAGTYDPP